MKNFKLTVTALLLFAALAVIGYALTPPPPPPPPVNQNIGIYDTSIDQFKTNATDQSACRACHQTSGTVTPGGYNNTIGGVPTRHHDLLVRGVINPSTGAPFGCQDCHPSTPGAGNGILLDRSCTDCHNATNFWADSIGAHVGNLNRPHHYNTSYDDANIGNPAASRQCNLCHGSFVNNYNDGHYVPSYNTSFVITPYATWKATNISQPLSMVLFDSTNRQDLNKAWGGCESCHLGTVNNTGYNGTGYPTSGTIGTNHNNHHREILGGNVTTNGVVSPLGASTPFVGVSNICSVCHVITPGGTGPYRFNTTNPFTGETLIRAMEVRNSTIEQADAAIGAFEPGTVNITINGTGCEKCHGVPSIHNIQYNYVQNGPQGFGHINNNTDCYGCHNSWLPANDFVPGPLIPTVDSVTPSVMAAGTATTLTITGSNFVNDAYTSVVSVDGIHWTPSSITASKITVNIPALPAGVYKLQLVKGDNTLSKLSTLTVVSSPTITSANITENGSVLTIDGTGFGAKPATDAQLYVSVSHAGNQIASSSIVIWKDTEITAMMPSDVTSGGDVVTVLTGTSGEAKATITEATSGCVATLPGSGPIGFDDFQAFAASYGTHQGDANYDAIYDFNHDGRIAFDDFQTLAAIYGTTCRTG